MPSPSTRACGDHFEAAAGAYLERQGYIIVAKNYRTRFGEIDIIARKGSIMCFVEVKASQTERFGDPIEKITAAKRRTIIRVARQFLAKDDRWRDFDPRFDVITFHRNRLDDEAVIQHFEDAFRS